MGKKSVIGKSAQARRGGIHGRESLHLNPKRKEGKNVGE